MTDLNSGLLMVCIVILSYLVYQKFKPKEPPLSPGLPPLRFKSVTKISSEKSILSLPKVSEISWRSKKVPRICISGGPCAGKTTSLARLSLRLPEQGYKVFTVPEAATLLRSGGAMINMSNFDDTQKIDFQLRLVKLQLALEDIFTTIAEHSGGKAIVICDRGVMDGAAYIPQDLWQALLDEMGLTKVHLRDCRYDILLHLVTAAQGAEKHFSNKNNVARYEDLEEARNIDRQLLRAWTGHPKMFIIDNERVSSFDQKIEKCIEIVFSHLNLPSQNHFNYKFLIKMRPHDWKMPDYIEYQKISVEETFLMRQKADRTIVERVQRRGYNNSYTYLYVRELMIDDARNLKTTESNIISSREYISYLKRRDRTRKTVHRTLLCFIYAEDYMILDTFENVVKGLTILRIQTKKPRDELILPEFVTVIRDVMNDMSYSTHILAKNDYFLDEIDVTKL
ncbi:unnamed protein product [Blepharisma stoltei]|uniref:NadR/Ttd14 AAA domain-containing protein n=1 Tax=Blepharisma stoltei TaxID=1481888 RepID=A0AAU9JN72_9CILI|nr:unnamed protein product [Blepharisma stoltei]